MQRNNEVHWFLIWLLYSPKKLKMYLEHSSGQLKLFNAFMNQTNTLLVWFMIYNFKVNYSKDNLFFPNNFIDTPKSNTERRWETILINSRQSKKKRKRELPMYPSLVNSGTKHSFIIILIYQNQSKKRKRKERITRVPEFGELKYKSDSFKKLGRLVPESTKLGYQSV